MTIIVALAGLIGAVIGGLITVYLARKNRRHQLSMAALSERLKAYQELYSIWWEMSEKAPNPYKVDELNNDIQKAETLLKKKYLYLGKTISNDLSGAISAARKLQSLSTMLDPHGFFIYAKERNDNIKKLSKLGRTIEKEAGLPSFGEQKSLSKIKRLAHYLRSKIYCN